MDDVKQKLNSGNVFIQSQALSTVNDLILKKKDDSLESLYESDEIKMLWKVAHERELAVSTLAVEALVRLVRIGCLPAPATMQNFTADIVTSKSSLSLVRGITQLFIMLCESESGGTGPLRSPFSGPPSGSVHPYVLIIKKRPDLTNAVIEEIHYLLTHPNQRIQSSWKSLLQPFIYHVFCLTETSLPSAKPLLDLLLSKRASLGKDLVTMLCKVTSLIKVEERSHMERKILLLCAIAKIAMATKNDILSSAVLPCLVITLPRAVKYGLPTRVTEGYVTALVSHLQQGCDVTLCSLAEAIPHVSGQLQVTLLRVGATLLSHKDGNPLVGCRLLPSLLQALSAPCSVVDELSLASSTLVSLIQSLPAKPSVNAQLSGNEFWDSLSLSFPDLATFIPAIDLCNQIVKDPHCTAKWLSNLSSTVHQISKFHYSIVTAVFLYHGSTPESVKMATQVLEREVSKCEPLALELFPIALYRLGREPDPPTRLQLLYILPSLAVNKLCVAMIVKTLTALWSTSLKPLVLRLMLDVWRVEPRVYSFLSRLIHDNSTDTPELEIARAYVVAEICKAEPSQHVDDLLPILSGLLNNKAGTDGTPLTIIALDGIYELCSATVTDLRTTWNVIAPKLMKDKRPEVIVRLCRLLSLTPKLKVESKEYEEFTSNVASLLWGWATGKIKNSINEAAFRALEYFDPESFTLKILPAYAREGHRLPPKMACTPSEAARKAEDVLTYVPGLAWVKLAIGCPRPQIKFVEALLKSLVEREVTALPKGIYLSAIQEAKRKGYRSSGGQPEPLTYNFLPETSILRASVVFLQDFSKLLSEAESKDIEESEKLLQGVSLLLVSLGQALNRPFPALDWSFLNEVHGAAQKWNTGYPDRKWASKIREGIFRVTAQQCNKSSSALNVISKWLVPSSSLLTRQDEVYLFGLLDQLGRGLSTQILQDFLNHVFNEAIGHDDHIKKLLETIKPHITCDYVHESNRNAMSNAIEGLNDKMDTNKTSLYNAYKSCVADLPQKHIERLTSPSLWWEVTDEKLYRAAVLRCHVAIKDPEATALPWLNDLVDSAASLPGDRSHFLLVMAETLIERSEAKESSAWLLSLLGRLRDYLLRDAGDNLVLIHEHQQRITFYMDMLVMGLMIWSGIWATCSLDKLTSSPATRNLLLPAALISLHGRPDWSPTLPQLLNWFASSFALLEPLTSARYHLRQPLLLLGSLSPNLSQVMWNKIVALLI